MANRRKVPSNRQTQRVSRAVNDSTVGSHVQRSGSSRGYRQVGGRGESRGAHGYAESLAPSVTSGESHAAYRRRSQQRQYVQTMQNRARSRSIVVGIAIAVAVVAVAVLVGFLVFRGSVGSEMALRDSDASQALVSVRSDEPYYALITAELGAVAQPLEQTGPDVLLLAYVDRANEKLTLINIPPGLQVVSDGVTRRVADLALQGDAALIDAVSTFAKVDISHIVKVGDGGVAGIVEALGGIDVNIDQVIDDPHAGDVYLPAGTYNLNANSALTYLRAQNVKLGVADQLDHQTRFAALVFEKLFAGDGSFARRLESIDSYFQTDMSLGDIESLQGWLRNLSASDITCIVLPGYQTEVTGVVDTGDSLYIGSADKMAEIVATLEAGGVPDTKNAIDVDAAAPGSFTLEVQNGTSITGAASTTADTLAAQGFNIVAVGNAEQPVYDETLVVYQSAEGQGLARAKAVIEALGVGRAVSGDMYYSLNSDVLLLIGSDYKPFV